jgi:ABC-2 type transport system ATP-binding protein
MSQPVVRVQQLRKSFGDTTAVADISFSVAAGTVVGLLGPNGAGKTTTINCITTLLRPDGGEVSVGGFDVVRDADRVRAQIAVTGQFAALDDMLSGRENLVLFGRLLGLGRRAAAARAEDLLTRFDLTEVAGKAVRTYSGGLRRRLDLAVSLVVHRPLLILDEPTTGLDPRSRESLWAVIRELSAGGTTILLTTQYLEEADRLADGLLLIDHGRVIAAGRPAELKKGLGGAVCEVRIGDDATREQARDALEYRFRGLTVSGEVLTIPDADLDTLADAARCLSLAGVEPDDLALRRATLDEVFLSLTGKPAAATSEVTG